MTGALLGSLCYADFLRAVPLGRRWTREALVAFTAGSNLTCPARRLLLDVAGPTTRAGLASPTVNERAGLNSGPGELPGPFRFTVVRT